MSKKELKQYSEKDKVEVGLDEAGRGCLFGPVCVAGVVWLNEDPEDCVEIKDSKKCTEKHRNRCYDYIREKSISYSIHMIDNDEIDRENILKSSLKGMHQCLDSIGSEVNFDIILVDGNHFNTYYDKDRDDFIIHKCIIKGDNVYKSIAAASILAKTYRDRYIIDLVKEHPELVKYDIHNNKGYGTKKHMDAIKKYGITKWHRKTFSPCKDVIDKFSQN
tara:strand:- start:849 stop:1505 length:657 start_codon:yes stop_codon:yes gene_type:complete